MELTIHSCSFSEERRYRLNFNGKYDTDLIQQPTSSPVFERNIVRIPFVIQRDSKGYLFVSVLALENGMEVVLNNTVVDILDEPGVTSIKVDLMKSPESDITGTVYLSYKHIEMKLFSLLSQGAVCGIHATCSLLSDFIQSGNRRVSLNERDISLVANDSSGRPLASGKLPHIPVRNFTKADGGRSVMSVFLNFSRDVDRNTAADISLFEGGTALGTTIRLAYSGTVTTIVKLTDGVQMIVTYKFIHELPHGSCVVHELAIQDALQGPELEQQATNDGSIRAQPNLLLHLEIDPLKGQAGTDHDRTPQVFTGRMSVEDAIKGVLPLRQRLPSNNSSSSSSSSSADVVGMVHGAYLIPEFTLSGLSDSVISNVEGASANAGRKTRKILANAAKLKSEKAVLSLDQSFDRFGDSPLGSLHIRAILIDVCRQSSGGGSAVDRAADSDEANPELTPAQTQKGTRNAANSMTGDAFIVAEGFLKEITRNPGTIENTHVCMLAGKLKLRPGMGVSMGAVEGSSPATASAVEMKHEDEESDKDDGITVKATVTLISAVVEDASVNEGRARCLAALDNALGGFHVDKSPERSKVATPQVLSRVMDDPTSDMADGDKSGPQTPRGESQTHVAGTPSTGVGASRVGASDDISSDTTAVLHDMGSPIFRGGARFGDSLSPQLMSGQKPVAGAGHAIAELIKSELAEKQKIIDKLLDDAKVKDEAMATMASELKGLRDKSSYCESCMQELEAALRQRDTINVEAQKFVESATNTPVALGALKREDLLNVTIEIGRRYKAADAERLELKRLVTDAKSARRQYGELQKIHKELQDAHLLQNQYIQKMQKKQGQIKAYEATIQMQEKVIKKLQKLVETKFRDSRKQDSARGDAEPSLLSLLASPSDKKAAEQIGSNQQPSPTSALKANDEATAEDHNTNDSEKDGTHNNDDEKQQTPPPLPVPIPTRKGSISSESDVETLRARVREYESQLQKREKDHRSELEQMKEQYKNQVAQLQKLLADHNQEQAAAGSGVGLGSSSSTAEAAAAAAAATTEEGEGTMEKLRIRIDELEAEVASKSFRVAALEEQLVASAQESSREIAKLRTKLFELEISVAMGEEEVSSMAQDFNTLTGAEFEVKPWSREGNSVLRALVDEHHPEDKEPSPRSTGGMHGSKEPSPRSTGGGMGMHRPTSSTISAAAADSVPNSARGSASGLPSGTAAKAVTALRQNGASSLEANALSVSTEAPV